MAKEQRYVPTSKEQEFLDELRPFENKWVALFGQKVVASGDDPEEVQANAERAGVTNFSFYLVPSSTVSVAPTVYASS